MDGLYQIDLPYACFGLVIANGRVVRAPPIAAWARGRPKETVLLFYSSKGAVITRVALT